MVRPRALKSSASALRRRTRPVIWDRSLRLSLALSLLPLVSRFIHIHSYSDGRSSWPLWTLGTPTLLLLRPLFRHSGPLFLQRPAHRSSKQVSLSFQLLQTTANPLYPRQASRLCHRRLVCRGRLSLRPFLWRARVRSVGMQEAHGLPRTFQPLHQPTSPCSPSLPSSSHDEFSPPPREDVSERTLLLGPAPAKETDAAFFCHPQWIGWPGE